MLITLHFHSIAILIDDLQGVELHFGFSWPHSVLLFNLNQRENMISHDHLSVLTTKRTYGLVLLHAGVYGCGMYERECKAAMECT